MLADAQLQSAISGPSRATVTSLAGLGTGVSTLLMDAAYGAASGQIGHGSLFALFAVPYFAHALVTQDRRPDRAPLLTGANKDGSDLATTRSCRSDSPTGPAPGRGQVAGYSANCPGPKPQPTPAPSGNGR